jgi:hypothetical protein
VDQVLQPGWAEELVGVARTKGITRGHVVRTERVVGFSCWRRWAVVRSEVDGVYELEQDPRWIREGSSAAGCCGW